MSVEVQRTSLGQPSCLLMILRFLWLNMRWIFYDTGSRFELSLVYLSMITRSIFSLKNVVHIASQNKLKTLENISECQMTDKLSVWRWNATSTLNLPLFFKTLCVRRNSEHSRNSNTARKRSITNSSRFSSPVNLTNVASYTLRIHCRHSTTFFHREPWVTRSLQVAICESIS